MKVPAVTIDITDDGTTYTVTALPWPTIESSGHPYTARLRKPVADSRWGYTPDKLAAFVKKLLVMYPKVSA